MEGTRLTVNHFSAALAFRTQKALSDATEKFGSFSAGSYSPDRLPSFNAEIVRFHEMLEDLSSHFTSPA